MCRLYLQTQAGHVLSLFKSSLRAFLLLLMKNNMIKLVHSKSVESGESLISRTSQSETLNGVGAYGNSADYKFVHFTSTNETGAHKYITLLLYNSHSETDFGSKHFNDSVRHQTVVNYERTSVMGRTGTPTAI